MTSVISSARIVFCSPTSIPIVVAILLFDFRAFIIKKPRKRPPMLSNNAQGKIVRTNSLVIPIPPIEVGPNTFIVKKTARRMLENIFSGV